MRIFRLLSILMIIWGMSAPMACEDNSDKPCLMGKNNFLAINCLFRVVAPSTSYNEFLYADLGSFVWEEKDKESYLQFKVSREGVYEISPQVSIPKSVKAPYIDISGTIFIKDGAGVYQEIAKIQLFKVPNISKLTRVRQRLWDVTYESGHAEPIKDGSGTLMLSKVVEDRVDFEDDSSGDGQEPDTDDNLDTFKERPCPASIKEMISKSFVLPELQNDRDEAIVELKKKLINELVKYREQINSQID